MKMTAGIFVTALALVGCAKSLPQEDTQLYSIELQTQATKVTTGDRTSSGSYPLLWQKGDAVMVNSSIVSNPLGSEFDGLPKATFTTAQKVSYPVSVVYPASLTDAEGHIVIPSERDASIGSFAGGNTVLAGYATDGDAPITMAQTCGYIKVTLTGTHTLKSVTLKALGCELLAGTFTVDAQKACLSPVAGVPGSSSSRINTSATLSLTEPSEFVFSIPAGTYAKGFKLVASDNAGGQMSRTMFASSGKVVQAGMMTEMAPLAYNPSSPEAEIFEISVSSVSFTGSGYEGVTVSACAGNEPVDVSLTGLDWCKVTAPDTIAAAATVVMQFIPVSANVSDRREGSVTFRGITSGKTTVLPVSQGNMYTSSYGFPAKWYSPDVTAQMKENWASEGFISCTAGEGVGRTFLSLGTTVEGRTPTPIVYSNYAAGYGMVAGDYFQFSAPVQSVAAGTDLDLMITISPSAASAPKYWLVEWLDGGQWRSNPRYTASEDGKTPYSFYIKYFSSGNYRTHIESYTLKNAVKDDFVRVRVRAVGTWNNGGGTLGSNTSAVFLTPGTYLTYLVCYADEATPVKDTHKMAQYGNSITFYHGSAMMLKEIARREGHQLDVRINLKGSQEFEHHLTTLPFSQEITAEGGYDFAVMNDGSYFHAEYAAGSKEAIQGVTAKYTPEEILYWQKRMTAAIKEVSPQCQTVLTSEHSYSRKAADDNYLGFGSFENFDTYQWEGAQMLAKADSNLNWIAPAGKGFARARSAYGFTSAYNWMQHTDNYHPNLYGAYMRACIIYLTMFGGGFGDNPADCCLHPADAAKLRQAAMDIVSDSTREGFHFHK